MEKKELIEMIGEAMERWEKLLLGCPFCYPLEDTTCKGCPVKTRFGTCGLNKRNPTKGIGATVATPKIRKAVLKAGRKWLKELNSSADKE